MRVFVVEGVRWEWGGWVVLKRDGWEEKFVDERLG